jgi:hypothetical protein
MDVMKKYGLVLLALIVFVLIVFYSIACNRNNNEEKIKKIDFYSFSVQKMKKGIGFEKLGKFVKIIKLETKDESIIGEMSSVYIKNNGELLINDYHSSEKIMLFNAEGKFIRSYGKKGEGPGEYVQLTKASFFDDENVVLASPFKLIKFDKKGKLLKEIRINYFVGDMIAMNKKLYIYVSAYRGRFHGKKRKILIYNSKLENIGGIGKYDKRLDKYLYSPHNIFTNFDKNNKFAFIDYYDFKIQIYDTVLKEICSIEIPNDNKNYEKIWNKKRFIEDDRTEIKKKLHRFNSISGFKNSLLLFETCREKRIDNFWLLNLKTNKIKIFNYGSSIDGLSQVYWNSVNGTYRNGVIVELYFNDEKEFNVYKKSIPLLKNYKFNMDDNALLGFFEFNNFQ